MATFSANLSTLLSGKTTATTSSASSSKQIASSAIPMQTTPSGAAYIPMVAIARPSCLPSASLQSAKQLCAAKRAAGQEAVAAVAGSLGADDPYIAAIQADPCSWMNIPECAPPPKPSIRAAGKGVLTSAGPAPATTVYPLPPPVVAAPPKSHTALIVGGLLVAAIGAGVYLHHRKAS